MASLSYVGGSGKIPDFFYLGIALAGATGKTGAEPLNRYDSATPTEPKLTTGGL